MGTSLKVLTLCCFAVFLTSGLTNDVIAKDVRDAGNIVIADNSGEIEKHAASELAHYLQKVSGAEISVKQQLTEKAGCYNIYLGTVSNCRYMKPDIKEKAEKLGDEGFVIKSDNSGLYIIGKNPLGVLYGVYAFLEKYVGLRWFFPGEEGEYCPHSASIRIPAIDEIQEPSFKYRVMFPTGCNVAEGRGIVDTWDWMVRNRMQILLPSSGTYAQHKKFLQKRGAKVLEGGHDFFVTFISDAKYFETHPEYFSLIDGKRVPQKPLGAGCAQSHVCVSNPDVVKLCAEGILDFFQEYPRGVGQFLLGAADNCHNWCQCENCRKLDPPGSRSYTTRLYKCFNQIVNIVYKKYPDADMWAWAYSDFREVPIGVTPDSRLKISLCVHGRCYTHPINDPGCAINRRFMALMNDWLKANHNILMREYLPFCQANYAPLETVVEKDLKYYHSRGIIGWEDEVAAPDAIYYGRHKRNYNDWHARWQQNYLVTKLLWNVNQNFEILVNDMEEKYYGVACPAMSEYRKLLASLWTQPSVHAYYGAGNKPGGQCLMRPNAETKLNQYLAEAKKLAEGNDKILKRIEKEEKYFDFWWVQPYHKYLKNIKNDIVINKKQNDLKIDGSLDESDWKNATYVTDFKKSGDVSAVTPTFARMCYDSDNLYLAVEAMEPNPQALKSRCKERDGKEIWRDDTIELFTSPANCLGEKYYQIAINPAGVFYDAECDLAKPFNVEFDSRAEIKTKIINDRWQAEIRIPVAPMKAAITEGVLWKVNIARGRLIDEKPEYSSISGGSFHGIQTFRTVVFGEGYIENGSFDDIEVPKPGSFKGWKIVNGKVPRYWILHSIRPGPGTAETVLRDVLSKNYCLKITDGWIFQVLLPLSKHKVDAIDIQFEAMGKGSLMVAVYRYKRGDKGLEFLKTDALGVFELDSADWKNYKLPYRLNTGEIIALAFRVNGEISLDNVSVSIAKDTGGKAAN